jgi:hypothetical protein
VSGQGKRTARALHVEALDALLNGRMAAIAVARDWELLREVARLAAQDAPPELSRTDPTLFANWRAAVTKYHLKGWTHMTPERVDAVSEKAMQRQEGARVS